MTSLAFIAGLTPLMNVRGASAQGNHSISIGTAGGMLSGVVHRVFIIPALFIIFQYLQERISVQQTGRGSRGRMEAVPVHEPTT